MKTNQQIILFLKHFYPKNEVDELAIISYCSKNFNLKIKNTGDKDGREPITFEEFKKWLGSKTPPIGSYIVYDKTESTNYTIAIVKEVKIDSFVVGAKWYADGLDTQFSEMPNKGWKKASGVEIQEITKELSKIGMEWNRKYCKVVEKYIPKNGDFVRIYHNEVVAGYGVLNEVNSDEGIFMYCVKLKDSSVRYNLHEFIGKYSEFQFELAGNTDRGKFMKELEEVGVTWNAYLKRIEPLDMRVKKGDAYWYINDRFQVVTAHDSYTTQDKKRYLCGNYYNDPDDCYESQRILSDMIKNRLARPVVK